MTLKFVAALVAAFLAVGLIAYLSKDKIAQYVFAPTASRLPLGQEQADVAQSDIEVVASDLEIPWEIVFLPDGDMLVTERPGRLLRIGERGAAYKIEGVEHVGEGGLQGMALHPDFADNHWLYLYLTSRSGDGLINRIERYRYVDDRLSERTVVFDNLPGAQYHDGGRIEFGPDGYLYVTVGDATQENLAQDRQSLAGAVLRIADDGTVPDGNPFGNAVWSYGHRNPQGLAWDDQGRLWATEHGRSGLKSGYDELNLIEPGANYGWPAIQGDETREGMITPAAHSGPDETWAPAGMVFWDNSLLFAGLRGESLYQARLGEDGQVINLVSHFRDDFGRLRAVQLGPDGYIYLSTSNRDGRGPVAPGDDRIIRINPAVLAGSSGN